MDTVYIIPRWKIANFYVPVVYNSSIGILYKIWSKLKYNGDVKPCDNLLGRKVSRTYRLTHRIAEAYTELCHRAIKHVNGLKNTCWLNMFLRRSSVRKRTLPVPVESFVIMPVEKMYLWPWSSYVRMNFQKLEQRPRSSLLNSDDDGVRKSTPSTFQRLHFSQVWRHGGKVTRRDLHDSLFMVAGSPRDVISSFTVACYSEPETAWRGRWSRVVEEKSK